jgi:nucleoside-diphosphate-sugar epimerase
MKVLVTGHNGYIGPHLIELLHKNGDEVIGLDINLFDGCAWDSYEKPDKEIIKDVRDVTKEDLEGVDCVMHLAALSNDPMGDIDESLTYKINREGSINLAKTAKEAGVKQFLFSSSCSIYGKGEKLDLEETDPTHPITAYAHSKIDTENAVMDMVDDTFTASYLRNATAYGYSPMLRIDLVVNNLLGCALANGNIQIKSDGTPWRPLIHCRDIAHAFVAIRNAEREKVHNQIFNIGGNTENYQVKDVADLVKKLVPEADIVFTGEVGEDPRNYRVKFDKVNRLVPGFKLEYDLKKGMEELFEQYKAHNFDKADFDGEQFVRLRTLKNRLNLIQR